MVVRALLAAATVALALVGAQAAEASSPIYYLSLGDSLAQGVQPDAAGNDELTNDGYADDLYSLERFRVRGLQLAKLGCPAATTATMINGADLCSSHYATGNQLGDAVKFLQSHRVAFVTLDIGANDVDHCVTTTAVDDACVAGGIADAGANLKTILSTLRTAAPHVPIYGMNYYDPYLAASLQGPAGQTLAAQSLALTSTFNGVLDGVYNAFSVPVADVFDAFASGNTHPIPFLNVPVDVGAVCTLTWMCAPPPVGPNIHANRAGYWLIAGTFARTIATNR